MEVTQNNFHKVYRWWGGGGIYNSAKMYKNGDTNSVSDVVKI